MHPITKALSLAVSLSVCLFGASALAAGGKAEKPKHVHWHFDGAFGTFDKDAVQRGFQVYRTVCAACHSVEQLSFRNFGQRGGPYFLDKCPEGVPDGTDCSNPNDNPIVKALAAEYEITDGPDEFGDDFQRPGLPSDRLPKPFANENIARLANGGALPPDLSLITKARHHGPDYVYSLLTGYADAPPSVEVPAGQYYNPYFPGDMSQLLKPEYFDAEGHVEKGVDVPKGGVLAMASPLADGVVDYEDEETPETVEQYAADVVEFLAWAGEPKMEARKKLGVMSLIYLLILCGILYWSYREIWANVKK